MLANSTKKIGIYKMITPPQILASKKTFVLSLPYSNWSPKHVRYIDTTHWLGIRLLQNQRTRRHHCWMFCKSELIQFPQKPASWRRYCCHHHFKVASSEMPLRLESSSLKKVTLFRLSPPRLPPPCLKACNAGASPGRRGHQWCPNNLMISVFWSL